MASEAIVARLKAVLSGDSSQLRADLGKAEQSLKNFGDKATKTGRSLTTKVTLPMVGLGAAAVKTAVDFESSMTKITALVGVAKDEVDSMSVAVRSMATQFGKSANEAADALFYITSAGLRGATATDTLAASLKASAIGLGETSTIADLATSALNAYGADVLSAAQATDVMTATIREGKLETTELAGSMGRVLPLASAMGVNFNEVGAAFAALSRTGTNAAEAATQIRGILASLLRPTKQAEEALTEMGLSSEGLRRQMREEGLLATLKTLSEEFAGNEAAAASVFGNIRALSGVLDLMGANVATTEAIFASMADTTGAVDEAFAQVSETAAFQFQQATAEMKETLLALGQDLLPLVKDALELVSDSIRSVTGFFQGMDDDTQRAIKTLAGVAAIAGPVALGIGMVTKALIALGNATPWMVGLTAAVTALSLVFADYVRDAREARERADEMTESFKRANDPAYLVSERLEAIATSMAKVKAEASDTGEAVESFVGEAALMGALAGQGLLDTFNAVGVSSEGMLGALESGAEGFGKFAKFTELGENGVRRQMTAMIEAKGPAAEMAQAILDIQESGELSNRELFQLIHTIAEQTNAVTASNEAMEAQNAELITSTELFKKFEGSAVEPLVKKILGEYDPALNNATETLLRLAEATDGYAYQSAVDLERALKNVGYSIRDLSGDTEEVVDDTVALAQNLIDAADAAGYDARKTRDLIAQLGILDQLDPQVVIDLGLDITGAAQVIKFVDDLIEAQKKALMAMGDGRFIMRALEPLFALRTALTGALDPEEVKADKTSPASSAMDELERAEKEAAREAERLQREIERLMERVEDMGKVLGDEDFFEFLLGASADQIEDRFEDIAEAAMELVEQANELGVAGGAEFLQTLAAIGDQFDALAALQADVARTQTELSAAEDRLADATSNLASAQADLNRENDRYAAFLYGEGRGGGTFEQRLQTEIDAYRNLQRELEGLESAQAGFRQRIVDMMAPDVGGFAGRGGVLGNLGNTLTQARKFRDNLVELRDRGFPTDVIGQVVAAGMTQGNTIARRLLSLGTGEFREFLELSQEIQRIGVETAAIAGEVVFGADIADAQGAVERQFAIVDSMFRSAIAQAQDNVRAQAAIVDQLRVALRAVEYRMESLRANVEILAADIQTSLTTAFNEFLTGLAAAIAAIPTQVQTVTKPVAAPKPPSIPAPAKPKPVTRPPAPAPLPPLEERYPTLPSTPRPTPERAYDGIVRILPIVEAPRPTPEKAYEGIVRTLPIAPPPKENLKLPGGGGFGRVMRAKGGPVVGGYPYIVGEMGPELFVPGQSGVVLPNSMSGGGGTAVTYNINVNANGDAAEAGRQIVKAIQEYERRNGTRWRS